MKPEDYALIACLAFAIIFILAFFS